MPSLQVYSSRRKFDQQKMLCKILQRRKHFRTKIQPSVYRGKGDNTRRSGWIHPLLNWVTGSALEILQWTHLRQVLKFLQQSFRCGNCSPRTTYSHHDTFNVAVLFDSLQLWCKFPHGLSVDWPINFEKGDLIRDCIRPSFVKIVLQFNNQVRIQQGLCGLRNTVQTEVGEVAVQEK